LSPSSRWSAPGGGCKSWAERKSTYPETAPFSRPSDVEVKNSVPLSAPSPGSLPTRSMYQEILMTTFREEDLLAASDEATARVKTNRRLVSKGGVQ